MQRPKGGVTESATQIDRRELLRIGSLAAMGAGGLAVTPHLFGTEPSQTGKRLRMAIITTIWRTGSHAWHMAERFLVGYPRRGRWHKPPIDVVGAYVDQIAADDLSRPRSKEFNFPIYPTIAEALRCGGDQLAVDCVLLIGEHGDYPRNEFGQKLYPRYEFFKQITDVFRQDGRSVPIFNDKHLSWKWEHAQEMVNISRELNFPFMAGSSLPVTHRMPAVEIPFGAEIEEVVHVNNGVDDYHSFEALQCMVERRRGGETGIAAVQVQKEDAVWRAMEAHGWDAGGWDPRLFEACLSRSQKLTQEEANSHRYPSLAQMRQWTKSPWFYRIEYCDGLKVTLLVLQGLVGDITFAARLKGESEPVSTMFYLHNAPNIYYSSALMSQAEDMFVTGKAAYPVERTLLASGLIQAACQSHTTDQRRIETPHLDVRYTVSPQSHFIND